MTASKEAIEKLNRGEVSSWEEEEEEEEEEREREREREKAKKREKGTTHLSLRPHSAQKPSLSLSRTFSDTTTRPRSAMGRPSVSPSSSRSVGGKREKEGERERETERLKVVNGIRKSPKSSTSKRFSTDSNFSEKALEEALQEKEELIGERDGERERENERREKEREREIRGAVKANSENGMHVSERKERQREMEREERKRQNELERERERDHERERENEREREREREREAQLSSSSPHLVKMPIDINRKYVSGQELSLNEAVSQKLAQLGQRQSNFRLFSSAGSQLSLLSSSKDIQNHSHTAHSHNDLSERFPLSRSQTMTSSSPYHGKDGWTRRLSSTSTSSFISHDSSTRPGLSKMSSFEDTPSDPPSREREREREREDEEFESTM